MKKPVKTVIAAMGAIAILSMAAPAQAQLDNKPFAFKNSPGGLGMSVGGRQAIFNEKFFGLSPKNLVRGTGGILLDVQKGPGSVAVVSFQGTSEVIPSFRGTSYKGTHANLAAGNFNPFFSPSSGSGSAGSDVSHIHSGATVSTWTGRVSSGGIPVSYLGPDNAVDSWTGQVYDY